MLMNSAAYSMNGRDANLMRYHKIFEKYSF